MVTEGIRNQHEIIVLGMKRTGNHGIITWINHLFSEPVYFINNVRHFTDPFAKNHEFRKHANSNCVNLHKNKYPDELFSTEIRNQPKETLLISYEDLDLPLLAEQPLIEDKTGKIGKSAKETTVLLLRDHYNIIASRMKMFRKEGSAVSLKRMQRDLDLWKVYAHEFLQDTNYIGQDNTVRISYNNWFTSEDYRRSLAEQLGQPFSDAGLEIMPPQGSSFDDRAMDGKAQKMAVLDRWRQMIDDPIYSEVVRDEEAMDLSDKIFGMRPVLHKEG